ncbi:MAG: hypothetical protein ACNA8H_10650 [Anaerolineales bacterium]
MLKHSILHEKEMVDCSEKSDPILKYYNQTVAVTSPGDIAWFVEQAQISGGRKQDRYLFYTLIRHAHLGL